MTVYVDSSALVKRYVDEEGSEELRGLLTGGHLAASATVTYVEIASALSKAARLGRLREDEARRAFAAFESDWQASIVQIQTTEHVLHQAAELVWRHGLRGCDALQLAAAVWFQKETSEPVLFATYDQALAAAARKERVRVWP